MTNIKYIIHTFILFMIQLFILDNLQLNSYVYMNIYILAIMIFPYNANRVSVLLLGFLCGLIMDMANYTMGIHTAASTLIAYLRPHLLLGMTNKNQVNDLKGSRRTSGFRWFFKYTLFLVFIFNVVLIMTETFSFSSIGASVIRIIFSTLASTTLIFLYYFIAIKEKQS